MDLVDLDQIDVDEKGPIKPAATGLGAEIMRNWEESVEEAVVERLAIQEAAMREQMQVRSHRVTEACVCRRGRASYPPGRLPMVSQVGSNQGKKVIFTPRSRGR